MSPYTELLRDIETMKEHSEELDLILIKYHQEITDHRMRKKYHLLIMDNMDQVVDEQIIHWEQVVAEQSLELEQIVAEQSLELEQVVAEQSLELEQVVAEQIVQQKPEVPKESLNIDKLFGEESLDLEQEAAQDEAEKETRHFLKQILPDPSDLILYILGFFSISFFALCTFGL